MTFLANLARTLRATEGLADSVIASGASGYGWDDPDDPDGYGYRRIGAGRREVPRFTLEKARTLSVHSYRTNPMARAIIDTYVSFCVGDVGLQLSCSNPEVDRVARRFWDDPANNLPGEQELLLRSHLLLGETSLEMMVGELTGATRFAYIAPESIASVGIKDGNPLWRDQLYISQQNGEVVPMSIARVDEITELRQGEAMFWPDWRAVVSDRRGVPFLAPIVDWLDAYDRILYNLIDRTALARYLVWDVTVAGDQTEVDKFIEQRGGQHAPKSGTVEVHNEGVTWKPQTAQAGAYEDRVTASTAMTNLAAGAGLSKVWLAEPEDANKATSQSMAEPVRRRVGGVQQMWLNHMTELVRYAVDQAVRKGTLPFTVPIVSPGGDEVQVPASDTVTISGPEIAASDSKVNAEILVNLATAFTGLVSQGLMSKPAAEEAVRKAWEGFTGLPYSHQLDDDPDVTDVENYLEEQADGMTAAGPVAGAFFGG